MANQSRSFEAQMKAALKEFNSDVVDAMNKTIDSTAKEAIRRLKDTSPKRKAKGRGYSRGWSKQVERPRIGSQIVTIYNRTHGWQTHLLEHGHIVRNKKGTYGRAQARVHIAPVEEWVVEETPKRFEEELTK